LHPLRKRAANVIFIVFVAKRKGLKIKILASLRIAGNKSSCFSYFCRILKGNESP